MVRRLPGGITLPALQTGRPADAEASALIVALSRDGRWEVCAEHEPGAPGGLARIEQDLNRGVDSVRMMGHATTKNVEAALDLLDLSETGVVWEQGNGVSERLDALLRA